MTQFYDNSKESKLVALDTAEQLINDLTDDGNSDISFIKFNSHTDMWEVAFKSSEDMEFSDFHQLYEFLTTEGQA